MATVECKNYKIYLNENWNLLNKIIAELNPTKIFVIVDENTKHHCLPIFKENFTEEFLTIEIESGERNKTIESSRYIWDHLIRLKADRSSLIINLGGGVIGDMGGYCASCYMRGLRFIQIPTTLLSMVDASVGSKLGIDYQGHKNIIGLFNDPELVWIQTSFLDTLSKRQLKSGFAEVIKHSLVSDTLDFEKLSTTHVNETHITESLVYNSIKVKNEIVKSDPFDLAKRKVLNFGHTIGHAIEATFVNTEKEIFHGEAIAIGMICESYLSHRLNRLKKSELDVISNYINVNYDTILILEKDQKSILEFLKLDKKNKDNKLLFVLLDKIGTASYDHQVSEKNILESLNYYLSI